MTVSPALLSALVITALCLLLFFVLREVFCWYFKINKMVDILTKQNELLQKIADALSGKSPNANP